MADRDVRPVLRMPDLWRLLGPFRYRALAVLTLVMVDTILASLGVGAVLPVLEAILDPAHHSAIVTRVVPSFDTLSSDARLLTLVFGTVALYAARAGVALLTVSRSHRLLQHVRAHWIDRIGTFYLCSPFGRVASRKQGELLNDWFNETISGTRFYQAQLAYITSLVLVLALLILGLVVDWRAMLAMTVGGLAIGVIVRKTLYGRSATFSTEKLRVNQGVSAAMVEDLANVREIKLMRAEALRLAHLGDLAARLGRILVRSAVIGEAPRIVSEFIAVALMLSMVVLGSVVMNLPAETILPAVVFFSVAAYRLVTAASQMIGARLKALNDLESLRRVAEIVGSADERELLDRGEGVGRIDTDIVLRGINYESVAGVRVLVDVDAIIPRGRLTFLVGPSGSGKSTLLDLLLRLIEPSAGSIEANGRQISAFRLDQWRHMFGYVSQDAALFNGSIRMNLLLARPEATDAELLEACRLAGAEVVLRMLPDGLDSTVGDRGYSLSGGERKRIAIARALVGRPSVLILDEATTSFEQSLEYEMLSQLRAARPELTIIQVTHRLQSIACADWVIALEAGRVTAAGPPSQIAPSAVAQIANT